MGSVLKGLIFLALGIVLIIDPSGILETIGVAHYAQTGLYCVGTVIPTILFGNVCAGFSITLGLVLGLVFILVGIKEL